METVKSLKKIANIVFIASLVIMGILLVVLLFDKWPPIYLLFVLLLPISGWLGYVFINWMAEVLENLISINRNSKL